MKPFYQQTQEEIYKQLESSKDGLTSTKANEILEEEGENVLKEKNKKSAFKILLDQFSNMMIFMSNYRTTLILNAIL